MQSIPPHHHCKICGASIPLEDSVCSVKCAQSRVHQARQQRMYTLIFVLISVVLVVALVVHP